MTVLEPARPAARNGEDATAVLPIVDDPTVVDLPQPGMARSRRRRRLPGRHRRAAAAAGGVAAVGFLAIGGWAWQGGDNLDVRGAAGTPEGFEQPAPGEVPPTICNDLDRLLDAVARDRLASERRPDTADVERAEAALDQQALAIVVEQDRFGC